MGANAFKWAKWMTFAGKIEFFLGFHAARLRLNAMAKSRL
jgi:hypothetical protein